MCEQCGEGEATVHLTQVADGAVRKLHLCGVCAAEKGIDLNPPASVNDLMEQMGGTPEPAPVAEGQPACPECHMSLEDFRNTQRLGCPFCYEAFAEELGKLLKDMHLSDTHRGKVPGYAHGRARGGEDLSVLHARLADAVAAEQYEKAARLRDEILCRNGAAD